MSTLPYDHLLHELVAATDDFVRSFDGVSAEQWGHKPAPEVWSIGETAEHTAAVFRGTQRLLTDKLLTMPIPADAGERVSDNTIVQSMFNRARKWNAPEMALPRGRWATREALTDDFVASRNKLAAWLREQEQDLRTFAAPHPVMGLLDGVQWLIFLAAHTERHTRQIVELKKAGR